MDTLDCINRHVCEILFSSLLIYWIAWIGLQMLSQPCIPGIEPTWFWCVSLCVLGWVRCVSVRLRRYEYIYAMCYFSIVCVLSLILFVSPWYCTQFHELERASNSLLRLCKIVASLHVGSDVTSEVALGRILRRNALTELNLLMYSRQFNLSNS